MSIGKRIALTFVIVLAFLFALALCGYESGRWDEEGGELKFTQEQSWSKRHRFSLASVPQAQAETSSQSEPIGCMNAETRERIRSIMYDAIDDALHDHIKSLFGVWMKDERGQPSRAGVGARQGVRANLFARKGANDWSPPECP